jgi:hypothetical protein
MASNVGLTKRTYRYEGTTIESTNVACRVLYERRSDTGAAVILLYSSVKNDLPSSHGEAHA